MLIEKKSFEQPSDRSDDTYEELILASDSNDFQVDDNL